MGFCTEEHHCDTHVGSKLCEVHQKKTWVWSQDTFPNVPVKLRAQIATAPSLKVAHHH